MEYTIHLTAYDKRKSPFLVCTRSGIGYTSVVATITIAQCSIICNLQHGSAVGVVACSEVSVPNSNPGTICVVPISSCVGAVMRGAVNPDSTKSVKI